MSEEKSNPLVRSRMGGDNGKLKQVKIEFNPDEYHIDDKLQADIDKIAAVIGNAHNFGSEMGNRGYLLHGPPGTGKTLGIKLISSLSGLRVFSGAGMMDATSVENTFKELRKIAGQEPGQNDTYRKGAILFIDEVDRLSSRADVVDPQQKATLNQLLTEMDGMGDNNGIFVFGTTNLPDSLDDALRRPGRFGREISFMPPNEAGRYKILEIHAIGKSEQSREQGGHKFIVRPEDLDIIAKGTYGYTGADLKGLLDMAFEQTSDRLWKQHKSYDVPMVVTAEDLAYGLEKTSPSALRSMPFIEPKLTLDDFAGYEDHKELLRTIFTNSEEAMMLFYGPPGVGKTKIAEGLAGEFGYNLIQISGSDVKDKFVGETEKKLGEYIDRAKQLAPCMLVFDEVDSLVENKGVLSHDSSWTGLLQSRLSQPIEGVYVVATVNNPSMLKGSFADRFQDKIYFDMPNSKEQAAIWGKYLPEDSGVDIDTVIAANENLSPRQIQQIANQTQAYGIKPTTEILSELAKGKKPDHQELTKYKGLADSIGDSVQMHRDMARILATTYRDQS